LNHKHPSPADNTHRAAVFPCLTERTGTSTIHRQDTSDLKGRVVRFKAVDAEDGSAYAWIGFDDIVEMP